MNGYHQLALFVVLFGGFLGWGLALDYREWLKTHVFGEVPFRPKFTGWLKSLLPPKNWDYWAKRFDPEYLLNLPMIQSVDFAMNTQQQFIRPKASQFPELDWGLLKAMEERRELVNCWAEAIIDNQVINVGFDIPKNVQDKIIIGTYLTPEERAKYFD